MSRTICPDGQYDIFPPEMMQECFAHKVPEPPKLDLPYPRSADVSIDRVAAILGTSPRTVNRLFKGQRLSGYVIGARHAKSVRIEYASLVAYCDNLRLQAGVAARPQTPKGLRADPRKLLPFPIEDTVTKEFVAEKLDCGRELVVKLIEEGILAAYRVTDDLRSPWRIDVRSLEKYMEKLREQASRSALRVPASRR